jgi:hypothetical protein
LTWSRMAGFTFMVVHVLCKLSVLLHL